MKYYSIMAHSDPKVIGVNNGIFQSEVVSEKFSTPNSFTELESIFGWSTYCESASNRFPEEFEFEYVRLLKKAKLTNVISFTPKLVGFNFILSSKAKQLLENLNLPNCSFFATNLFDYNGKRIEDDFAILQSSYHGYDTINFKKSIFYSGSEILGKTYHQVDNYESFLAEKGNFPLLGAEQIALRKEFADSDFIMTWLSGFPFVSERLLDRWAEFEVSGYKTFEKVKLVVV